MDYLEIYVSPVLCILKGTEFDISPPAEMETQRAVWKPACESEILTCWCTESRPHTFPSRVFRLPEPELPLRQRRRAYEPGVEWLQIAWACYEVEPWPVPQYPWVAQLPVLASLLLFFLVMMQHQLETEPNHDHSLDRSVEIEWHLALLDLPQQELQGKSYKMHKNNKVFNA